MTFPDDKFASLQKYRFQTSFSINFIYPVNIYEAPSVPGPGLSIGDLSSPARAKPLCALLKTALLKCQ